MTGTLLLKASHSDELVTRINHADINCKISTSRRIPRDPEPDVTVYLERLEESLRTLIKGIGDYLTRVVGSVPINLTITLRVYDDRASEDRFPFPVTVGPLHYEGNV